MKSRQSFLLESEQHGRQPDSHEIVSHHLRTPRVAAIVGIIFSSSLITSMLLIWISIPANPLGPATDAVNHSGTVSFTLDLLPFAVIANASRHSEEKRASTHGQM